MYENLIPTNKLFLMFLLLLFLLLPLLLPLDVIQKMDIEIASAIRSFYSTAVKLEKLKILLHIHAYLGSGLNLILRSDEGKVNRSFPPDRHFLKHSNHVQ